MAGMVRRALATIAVALAVGIAAPTSASGEAAAAGDQPYYVNLLFGAASERDFSELLTDPFSPRPTSDFIAVVSAGYELHRAFDRRLAFEIEGLYAHHWPRRVYHELGFSVNARWYDFPWNDHVPTSFAVGVGPSYTTAIPPIEEARGHHSRLLNQFNLELTGDVAQDPNLAVVLRLQHRSGVFGLINGVHGGSDFITVGVKWRFGP